jgi:hypothetical protein
MERMDDVMGDDERNFNSARLKDWEDGRAEVGDVRMERMEDAEDKDEDRKGCENQKNRHTKRYMQKIGYMERRRRGGKFGRKEGIESARDRATDRSHQGPSWGLLLPSCLAPPWVQADLLTDWPT